MGVQLVNFRMEDVERIEPWFDDPRGKIAWEDATGFVARRLCSS